MQLYQTHQNNLTQLSEAPFKLEKELQTLFENNLAQITGLQLVKSEFTLQQYRLDTLAYDPETKAFVIIEYKKDRFSSVLDQGATYLNTVLKHQSDVLMEYNERFNKNLKRKDIEWSQTKVMFVAPHFTDFQKGATDFKDLNIELWEVQRYQNNLVAIHPLHKSKNAPSIQQTQSIVSKQLKAYTEDDLLGDKSEDMIELYQTFKDALLNLAPDFDIKVTKLYVAFKKANRNCIDIQINKTQLKIWLNVPYFEDPKKLIKDMTNTGHHGNGACEITVINTDHLEYILSLVKDTLKD